MSTIYLVRPKEDRPEKDNRGVDPWSPWYDKCFGMVIKTETKKEAREIAQENSKAEEPRSWEENPESENVWMDEKLVEVVEVENLDNRLILQDVRMA